MVSPEDLPMSLVEGAEAIGRNLTTPGQAISAAVDQLNVDLLVIGCEASVSIEPITGSWGSTSLRQNTPPFSRAVRAATRAIIRREDQQNTTTEPQFRPISDGLIEQAMRDTTEGATWIDSNAITFREHIARQNALLMGSMILGLENGGYKPKAIRRDVRSEFDEILDGLWTRGSYSSFSESRVVAAIMRLSGVRNPLSTAHTFRRTFSFAREYGAGLAFTRLLPDRLAAEI